MVPPLLRVRRNSTLYSKSFLYFETVAGAGSVRGAADLLHISPSAISHQLASLEKEFGTVLLKRLPNGVKTTPAGEILLHHLQEASAGIEHGRAVIAAMTGAETGHLAIATHEGLSIAPLGELLAQFWIGSPGTQVSVLIGDEARILDLLVTGQIELGLGYATRTEQRVRRLWERPVGFGAIMAANHPLARHGRIALHELAPYPLLTPGSGSGVPQDIARYFQERKLAFDHRLATDSMTLVDQFARDSLGVAIKGRLGGALAGTATGILAFVPIVDLDKPFDTLAMLARGGQPLSASANAFVELAIRCLDAMDC